MSIEEIARALRRINPKVLVFTCGSQIYIAKREHPEEGVFPVLNQDANVYAQRDHFPRRVAASIIQDAREVIGHARL